MLLNADIGILQALGFEFEVHMQIVNTLLFATGYLAKYPVANNSVFTICICTSNSKPNACKIPISAFKSIQWPRRIRKQP